jgi:hypothetical protein
MNKTAIQEKLDEMRKDIAFQRKMTNTLKLRYEVELEELKRMQLIKKNYINIGNTPSSIMEKEEE